MSRIIRYAVRTSVRVSVAAVLILSFALVYLAVIGVPRRLIPLLLSPQQGSPITVEADELHFNILSGGIASGVRVYARGVVGPPFFEAREVAVDLDFLGPVRGRPAVTMVRATGGLFRLEMLSFDGQEQAPVAGPPWSVAFRLADIAFGGAVFDRIEGRIRSEGLSLFLEDAVIAYADGERRGQLRSDGSFHRGLRKLDVVCTLDGNPKPMLPIMDRMKLTGPARMIRRADFGTSVPRWRMTYTSGASAGDPARMTGQIWLQDFTYRGVDMLRADGSYTAAWYPSNAVVRFDPLLLVRDEGIAMATLDFDFRRGDSRMEFAVRSGLEPHASTSIVGVLTNGIFPQIQFEAPYRVAARGVVGLDGQGHRFDSEMYFGAMERRALRVDDVGFVLHHDYGSNQFRQIEGDFFGGVLTGGVDMVTRHHELTNGYYRLNVGIRDADFERITQRFRASEGAVHQGRMAIALDVSGAINDDWRRSMQGEGRMSVRDGRVFTLPVFGGLSSILGKRVPGLDLIMRQSSAKANFKVRRGVYRSRDVVIEGDVFTLLAKGAYGPAAELDFDVEITFLKGHTLVGKVIRIPTYLLSKLFKFKLTGTLQEPQWYPLNFSSDVWGSGNEEEKRSEGGSP